jgi:1-acyl-sn-glycerol-3-phosphate acyltransferase
VINPSEIIIEKSMRLIARGLAARRLETVASGLEHIPAHGPTLIAARHYHHLFDGLALFAAIPRPIHIVVTLDWAQNKPTKIFFAAINRLARWPTLLRGDALLRRVDGRQSLFSESDVLRYQREAMRQSVDLLVEGRLLVIFPEGYPNIDPVYTPKTALDEFLPFKPGFLTIAAAVEKRLRRSLPIVPAGFHYERGKSWVAHVTFGAPLHRRDFLSGRLLLADVERRVKGLSSPQSAQPP